MVAVVHAKLRSGAQQTKHVGVDGHHNTDYVKSLAAGFRRPVGRDRGKFKKYRKCMGLVA